MNAKVKTAVVGATGYAGYELARLLLKHPSVQSPLLLSREAGNGKTLADEYPHVSGLGAGDLKPFSWETLKQHGVDLLFLSTPHEVSREWLPLALERGLRVIDLSGAWRLHSAEYQKVYGFQDKDARAVAACMEKSLYGLPELHRARLAAAQVIANPGCYPTSIILALAPLLSARVVDLESGIICDSKSGVSGAGKQSNSRTHFVEVAENFQAYSVFNHRHTGEILEQLALKPSQLVFTPHLLPIPRGILSTIYLKLKQQMTASEVEGALRQFYSDSSFVRIFAPPKLPQIAFSLRTNFCDIGFALSPDGERLILISCIDNLMKGAAGQAVQNMNLMYGWPETTGLMN
jgi:N-acetyl-gamma-glutamyl-phosphate reductase